MKTVVTKGEYARLKGRQPSAVSNWIADGKISAAALVGDGNRARVWVEQADADLARNLDPAQQASQTVPIAPSLAPGYATSGPAPPPQMPMMEVGLDIRSSPRANLAAADDEDIRRRRKADADKAEHDAEAARRRNAVDEGRWMETAEAQRAWARELAKVISDVETFLASTLARELAQKHGLDWKELSVEVRRLFRAHRTDAANGAAEERARLEATAIAAE